MDGDQFVPIWTIACMEDVKALTTDLDLIVDVLKGIWDWSLYILLVYMYLANQLFLVVITPKLWFFFNSLL